MKYLLLLFVWFIFLFQSNELLADYKDDIGYNQLSHDLGSSTPTGTGLTVTQVEAQSSGHWMPDVTDSQFAGKTITDKTGNSTGTSSHATGVGRYFYGNTTATAQGITDIDAYEADNWLQLGFLGFGYLYNGNPFQPVYDRSALPWTFAAPARIANHSWVGTTSNNNYDGDILRRLDFVAARDEYIQITAVSNGTTIRPLLSNAYNSITVGVTAGDHPSGTTGIDDPYISGRTCPLIVAPFGYTSTSAPVLSSAIALLVETGQNPGLSTDPNVNSTTNRNGVVIYNAERMETIKAAILAGAQRVTDNTWSTDQIMIYQQDAANGLDIRFGAGQLDIYSSYGIIAAGEQNSFQDLPADGGSINARGFDVDPGFGGNGGTNTTGTYTFTAATDQRRLYAALVWNIHIDGGSGYNFDSTAMLYDLNLALYDISVTGYRRLVAQSVSTLDNTENLWTALVPGRTYEMEVSIASGQANFNWDYALAWRMETSQDRDNDGIPDDWEVQHHLDHTQSGDELLDRDNDSANNLEEYTYGTDPDNPDSDGDGQLDGMEIIFGTDPLDPHMVASVPSDQSMFRYLMVAVLLLFGTGTLRKKMQ